MMNARVRPRVRHGALLRGRASLLAGLATLLAPGAAMAQLPDFQDRLSVPFRFTGEVGTFGEMYSMSGGEARRPSATGRLFLRSRIALFGTVDVDLDLLYSTEGQSGFTLGGAGRQSINQFSLTPEWSWGRAYVGSFSDSYSSLTWDGTRVRGFGFNVNPGPVRLGAFRGKTQDAVLGGAVDGAYERTMWGGRIGYGRRAADGEGGFLDVVFLRTADDPSSLSSPAVLDEPATPTVNAFAVTPEENVVVAAVSRIPLWGERLVWSGELATSLHSRDRRAPELTEEALDEYVGLLRSFMTPRASTYGDVAHRAELELRNVNLPGATAQSPRTLSASVGYRHVGAGYVSLGLASLPADQSALNTQVGIRFRTWNASVRGMRQHDNLLDQKLATTTRHRFAANGSFRPSRSLATSVRASFNAIGNDSNDPDRRVDYTSWMVGATQTVQLAQHSMLRALSFSYAYQRAGDANPLRAANAIRAHDARVRTSLTVTPRLSITPGIGLSASNTGDTDWQLRHTYSLAANYRPSRGRWSTSASLANSRLNAGGAIQGALTARYNITASDLVTVSLRSNRVSGVQTDRGHFHENIATIRWSRSIR